MNKYIYEIEVNTLTGLPTGKISYLGIFNKRLYKKRTLNPLSFISNCEVISSQSPEDAEAIKKMSNRFIFQHPSEGYYGWVHYPNTFNVLNFLSYKRVITDEDYVLVMNHEDHLRGLRKNKKADLMSKHVFKIFPDGTIQDFNGNKMLQSASTQILNALSILNPELNSTNEHIRSYFNESPKTTF